MIEIDGSQGEGGGQVLRTSLSLSACTGRAFRLFDVRARRPSPGLKAQHLASVRAAAATCSARVDGDEIGSRQVTFRPGNCAPLDGERIDVGTAGAATLVLQTIAYPLWICGGNSQVEIRGGTHVPWSPSADYVADAWTGVLGLFGARCQVQVPAPGFFPKGRGRLLALLEPWTDRAGAGDLERGSLVSVVVRVMTSQLAGDVSVRMAATVREWFPEDNVVVDQRRVRGASPGAALQVTLAFERTVASFGALGEKGKPAEKVAAQACREARDFLATNAALDRHMADQVLIPAALSAGFTRFGTDAVTEHLRTNARIVSTFLDAKIDIDESGPTVTVRPE